MSTAREFEIPVYLKLMKAVLAGGDEATATILRSCGHQVRTLGPIDGRFYYLALSQPGAAVADVPGLAELAGEGGIRLLASQRRLSAKELSDIGGTVVREWSPEPLPNRPMSVMAQPKIVFNPRIDSLIQQIDTLSILNWLTRLQAFGTRYTYAGNRHAVADSIRRWFLALGLADTRIDTFLLATADPWGNNRQYDVAATLQGSLGQAEMFIVGGHFDSYSQSPFLLAPGVDDNGTGTATLLEFARILAAEPLDKAVRFVAFGAEELGLYGSYYYAQKVYREGLNVNCMINIDMIGNNQLLKDPRRFRIMAYPGSEAYTDLLAQAAAAYTQLDPYYSYEVNRSDSYPFYLYGFHALWPHEYIFSPVYHTDQDNLQFISLEYTAAVMKTTLAALATIANAPSTVKGITVEDPGTGSTLRVRWTANSEPDMAGYRIYYGTASGSYQQSVSTAATEITLAQLQPDVMYYVAVRAYDNDGNESPFAAEVSATSYSIPQRSDLMPCRPNPFRTRTTMVYRVGYEAGQSQPVTLSVCNIAGQRVRTLARQEQGPGVYYRSWDGADDAGKPAATGVYLCHLEVGGRSATQRVVLFR